MTVNSFILKDVVDGEQITFEKRAETRRLDIQDPGKILFGGVKGIKHM